MHWGGRFQQHSKCRLSEIQMNEVDKFLKKLWCFVCGEYYKISWFYLVVTLAAHFNHKRALSTLKNCLDWKYKRHRITKLAHEASRKIQST